jgi:hypothetical protein
MASAEQHSDHAFVVVSALLFAVSAVMTIVASGLLLTVRAAGLWTP